MPHRQRSSCALIVGLIAPLTAMLVANPGRGASVVSFGANGADELDDTLAFQNCINANSLITVPPGTYYISSKLSLPANRTLSGVNNDPAAAVLRLVGANDGIDVGPAANTTVQDLTLDRVSPNTGARALVYSGSSQFTVRRVNVLNHRSTAPAIVADTASQGLIEDTFVRDYGWFDTASSQVQGVGIRLSDCANSVVRNNRVIENRNLVPAVPVSNFYQAGGIEISGNVNALVEYNTIVTAGNGIDAGQASGSTVRYNTVVNSHEVGIKLVNGSRDNTVFANVVDKTGIAAIWLTPGSPGPAQAAIQQNTVRGNIVRGSGLGIGVDYWDVPSLRPSGIILDGSNTSATVVAQNNTIARNTIQPTRKLVAAVTEYEGFVFDPTANTITGNTLLPVERDEYGFFRPGFGAGLWRAVVNTGGSPTDIDGVAGDFVLSGEFGNGSASDAPLVGDVNGDGADDRVVYNAATHQWTWDSAPRNGLQVGGGYGDGVAEQAASAFGQAGDVPLLGDVNGDGAADRVLFRPSDSSWHASLSLIPVWPYAPSLQGFSAGVDTALGGAVAYDAGGVPVDGVMLSDYDGNGIADRTIFSAGSFYRTLNPGGGAWSDGSDSAAVGVGLGDATFLPPAWAGDFDGDGLSDTMAWNGVGNSTVFARLSTSTPAWGDSPTVQGSHFGDPHLDTAMFVGNFDLAEFTLAPLAAGDFNADGFVDGGDLTRWRARFGGASDWTLSDGDADGDGRVTGSDYLRWQQNLGVLSARGAAAIPEPLAAYMLAAGVGVLATGWHGKRALRR